jgi:hypothetical protein
MTSSEIETILKRLDNIDDKLDKYHEATTILNTVVLGKNGDPGLVRIVDENCKETMILKTRFWLLVGLLVGSGVLGGFGIAQLLS